MLGIAAQRTSRLLHVVDRHDGLVLVVLIGLALLLLLMMMMSLLAPVLAASIASFVAVSSSTLDVAPFAVAATVAATSAAPVPLALPLWALVLVVRSTAGKAPRALRWPLHFPTFASFGPAPLLPAAISLRCP